MDQGTGSNGSGTFSCTQQNNISGTGACGSLETSVGPPDSGTTELNTLDVLNVCGYGTGSNCPATVGNIQIALQFVIPSNTTYQALEFDPDVTWPDSSGTNYSHKVSVSCEFHPTNDPGNNPNGNAEWEYWDSSANMWEPFGSLGISGYIPCSLASGRHSIQLHATLDTANAQYYYQTLTVDGQQLFNQSLGPVNACDTANQAGPCTGFSQYIGVEQQVDNNTSTSSSTTCNPNSTQTVCAYYDNYSLTVW